MEKQGGYFNIDGEEYKNTLVAVGCTLFLRSMFRGESTLPTNFYIGLTNAGYNFDTTTIADLAVGEPSGNGYARQQVVRNTTDWTVQEVNGVIQAKSKTVTFTASANWNKTWQRAFLCSVVSGSSGDLYAVSGPTPAVRTVLLNNAPLITYEFWLRG